MKHRARRRTGSVAFSLGREHAGAARESSTALVEELHPSVDRCGERGEFHTFV